jgi:hypothetical protein
MLPGCFIKRDEAHGPRAHSQGLGSDSGLRLKHKAKVLGEASVNLAGKAIFFQ